MHLPAAERDAVILNLLRLDPLGRRGNTDLAGISDLRALWQAVEAAQRFRPATPKSLLPLPASKAALEAKAKDPKNRQDMMRVRMQMEQFNYTSRNEVNLTPAKAVSQQKLIQMISQFLGNSTVSMFD